MKKILILILSIALLLVIFPLAFGWLSFQTRIDLPLTGGIFTNYFHSGNGSEQNPYTITKPQHLYNLTMLYQELEDFDEEGMYFELSNSIDCSEIENFLPIGTISHPFRGNFNGNDFTINNLTITGSGESDVGFFGYVDDCAAISNVYIENLVISIDDCDTAASSVTIGHTAHLSNICYVGYIAGHIADATCFKNVYVNNCEITGTASNFESKWGYFGYCENAATLEQFVLHAQGQGQGNDWGGSIDMLSLNQRICYFLNNINKTSLPAGKYNNATPITYNKSIYTASGRNVFRYYVDDYQSYSTYSGSTYNNDPTFNQIVYRFVGGANNARATTSNYNSTSGTYFYDIPASYVPLLTKGASDNYAVKEENTGYFAGDLMHNSNTLRTASYSNSFIGNSYANGELEVLSNSTVSYNANNYRRINNGHTNILLSNYSADISVNKYPGYISAYEKMCNVLSSSAFVQGLHFTGGTINSSNTTTISKAFINGQLINNYRTLRNSIDFYAKENGSIKFFAGSYYNSIGINSDSFFSLHTVIRNGNTITTNQIYYVYENTNAETKNTYPHLYYNENNDLIDAGYGTNVTRGDLEFDMRWLHNAPPVANAVYYFEIPVNAGEFALGSVAANKTKGAYLMYLDIGASGESLVNNAIDDFKSIEYRSATDTVESSILLLTFKQLSEVDLSIKVYYNKLNSTYYITTNSAIMVTVTVLNENYNYSYNNQPIPSQIGSYNKT